MGSVVRSLAVVTILVLQSAFAHALRIDAQSKSEYINAVDVLKIEDMRSAIQKIWNHGLNPNSYWTQDMEQAFNSGRADSIKQRANQNFVRLLQDISVGVVDPEELNSNIAMKSKGFLNAKQLQAVITSAGQQAELLIESMAPRNPPYMALKAAMVRLYPSCYHNQWPALAQFKKTIRLGSNDPGVVSLKQRFRLLGYRISDMSSVVDQDTVNAINDVEWNMHIDPDGSMSPGGKVWKFLNVSCMDRVRQIQADMEKMRWFQQNFEERFILVNLAFSQFIMIDRTNGQNLATTYRTINGREARKTPTMRDKVVRVILNPYWIVPPTIFMEDKVQEIRSMNRAQIRAYFDEHNYEIWNESFTQRLNPETIDWWSITPDMDQKIYIRQKPNYLNALGVVKFELTNSMSIYLHDTNQRELFTKADRLISSGCVRLERPIDLAEYLLQGTEWTRSAIESTVAKPGEVMNKDTKINLKSPMPVYMVFLTSLLTSDNIVRFTTDEYNQNQEILAKFPPAL